jgi:hypothetical protein
MAKDPTYPKYAQDFIMDTLFLSDPEIAAYAKLEALCWMKDDLTIEDANKVHPLCEEIAKKFTEKFLIQDGKIICLTHLKTKKFREKQKKIVQQRWNKNTKHDTKIIPDNIPNKEIEIEIEIKDEFKKGGVGENKEKKEKHAKSFLLVPEMHAVWMNAKPKYPKDQAKDFPALHNLANFFSESAGIPYNPRDSALGAKILKIWEDVTSNIAKHNFFKNYSLNQVEKHIQNIIQDCQNAKPDGKQSHKVQYSSSISGVGRTIKFDRP